MNEKLITDLGENYEYVRTIVNNKIEIFKLDVAENASRAFGYIGLIFVIGNLLWILLLALLTALVLAISNALGSLVYSILIVSLGLVIISFLFYTFRKVLIFKPLAALFYRTMADKI